MKSIVPLCVVTTALILGFLLHAAVNDAKEKALTLNVRPRIAFAPADLQIFVRLVPESSDRSLRVWTDGENYSRSSAWTIEPSAKPQTFRVEWRRVFSGEYDIVASVSDSLSVIRASEVQRVLLTSP